MFAGIDYNSWHSISAITGMNYLVVAAALLQFGPVLCIPLLPRMLVNEADEWVDLDAHYRQLETIILQR